MTALCVGSPLGRATRLPASCDPGALTSSRRSRQGSHQGTAFASLVHIPFARRRALVSWAAHRPVASKERPQLPPLSITAARDLHLVLPQVLFRSCRTAGRGRILEIE